MTTKDYQRIAAIINNNHDGEGASRVIAMKIANQLANAFQKDNSVFDKRKFMRECGFHD